MKRPTTRHLSRVIAATAAAGLLGQGSVLSGFGARISRGTLVRLGGLGLSALAMAGWRSRAATRLSSGSPAPSSSGASCVLAPEQTQGPYYIAREKVRSTIAEHRPGTPLTLRLTVVDATTCTPLKGATVDIWHCDAAGVYSGFKAASTGGAPGGNGGPTDRDTFLRGIQPTDARGRCTFQTIYPGWYRGRTVHIHVMVHAGGSIVHTGQLYFPDSLTSAVYRAQPYRARAAARDTLNSTDAIYASGGAQSTLALTRMGGGGYLGTITLGVRHA
ncbi:MAG: hypothetical protein NVSMB65_08040 [Chloroflexota bacterium]